jgi:hypothetical protein
MSASDIVANHEPADLTDWEANHDIDDEKPTLKEFWEGKYKEASDSGLADSIVKGGYKGGDEPVTIHKTYGITDGHHRIAVMLRHSPNEPIPVSIESD